MLTTAQVEQLLNFLEPTLQQSMAANLLVGMRDPGIDKEKLKQEHNKASEELEKFFHNARHVNKIQPDCKNALPPEDDDGDVPAANEPKVLA